MELPRNITQVGETDRNCKIYVEDYVVSYMRQMNKFAEEKEIVFTAGATMSINTIAFGFASKILKSTVEENN